LNPLISIAGGALWVTADTESREIQARQWKMENGKWKNLPF